MQGFLAGSKKGSREFKRVCFRCWKETMEKAEEEYEIYRKREMKRFVSDYDNFKLLDNKTKNKSREWF